jgi:hypothetical protein
MDFCWETDFDDLFSKNPQSFSDVFFPNVGYTYIINLGTPFIMQLQKLLLKVKMMVSCQGIITSLVITLLETGFLI